jgi:hypothetical protein
VSAEVSAEVRAKDRNVRLAMNGLVKVKKIADQQ